MLVVEVFFDVVLFADCFERLGDLDCLAVGASDSVGLWSGCHYDELEVRCVVRFSFEFECKLGRSEVTTAMVLTVIKNYKRHTPQSRHWARSGQPCSPAEDLEDLEQSGKAFNSGEEEAGSIKLIGRADTLPTEGFYD